MSLRLVIVNYETAARFNRMWHRTHPKSPPGHKFSLGVADEADVLRGVALVGRPVAQGNQDGLTLEINRTATDGTKNANSMLYGAAARAAQPLGYWRVITYNQEGESGASLRAAGYTPVAELEPRPGWDCPARRREGHGSDNVRRIRWERICNPGARPWTEPSRPLAPVADGLPPTLWEAS
jgi:hypothetical protein